MAYTSESYLDEYQIAYDAVVASSMDSLANSKGAPLERLFKLIDDYSAHTTPEERISLKKDAYMQIMQQVISQSMATAIKLVDKKFTFDEEIRLAEAKATAEEIKNGLQADGTIDTTASNTAKQIAVLDAQAALYARQKDAFDDNKYQKLFDAQLKYNQFIFADADAPDVLDVALEAKVNDVFNRIISENNPLSTMSEA